MPPPTRPATGAPIAVAWGQYVHDTIINQQKGVVAVSQISDVVNVASGIVWAMRKFTGTDKWDGGGFHSTIDPIGNPHHINLGIPGLWAIYTSLQVSCGAGEHNHYAGVSYGGGTGSAPMSKDQRSARVVPSVSNRLNFGPWYVVSSGGGGSVIECWTASSHASGTEAVDGANNGTGEFAAFLLAVDLT